MKKIQKNLLVLAAIAAVLSAGIIPNSNHNSGNLPITGNPEASGEQTPGENRDDNDNGQNKNKPNCDEEPDHFSD